MAERDPVQRAAEDDRDLYGVATWDRRSRLDGVAARLHGGLLFVGRAIVVALALLIVGAQLLLTGVATIQEPLVGGYILLSVVPALALAAYVWYSDVTIQEPLGLLVVTFLLGILFAGFAAIVNSVLGAVLRTSLVGLILFYFLVVGPVEETVKWLAVRLYAYRSSPFNAVIDGAVYGAMAGLGFATVENSIYITGQYVNAVEAGGPVLAETFRTAAFRTLAGPGHVIYSAIAGYYLGLAKFNPRNRGPIVVKGLLVAALIHATYNTLVTILPAAVGSVPVLGTLDGGVLFLGFVVVYDGIFGYYLYRLLSRYRRAFREVGAARYFEDDASVAVERDEFEWDRTAVDGSGDATEDEGTDPIGEPSRDGVED